MKASLTLLLLSLINFTYAQTPDWMWAKSAGGTGTDDGCSIAVDGNGNSYVIGFFNSSTITFGSVTLTTNGNNDIFIVKYDAAGNVVWAKNQGGTDNDKGLAIAVNANGEVYVGGYFESTTITFGSTTLTNNGINDIFIAKYDSSGNVIWAKSAGGSNYELCSDIALDDNGNCWITGSFASDSLSFGLTTLSSHGYGDIFVAKYDMDGNPIWAKSAGNFEEDAGRGIAVDGDGNCYVTGYFSSSGVAFGSFTVPYYYLKDVFIVKYNTSGDVLWAKSAGSNDMDEGYDIATDNDGNCYITGYYSIGSITFGTTTLANSGVNDIFITKYDTDGNVVWAKKAGGELYDNSKSVAVDDYGNSYVTGSFSSSTIYFDNLSITNNGIDDIFIVKYNSSGNSIYVQSAGGNLSDVSRHIAVDHYGNCFITGTFSSNSIFFGTSTLTLSNVWDIFTAKLNGTTGAEEYDFAGQSQVFPNPFTSQTTITTKEPLDNATLILVNIFGQQLKVMHHINGYSITLTRQNLPKGVYLVQLYQDKRIIDDFKVIID